MASRSSFSPVPADQTILKPDGKAADVRQAIAESEAATNKPELRRLR